MPNRKNTGESTSKAENSSLGKEADEVKPKWAAQSSAAASSATQGKCVQIDDVPSFGDPASAKLTTVASYSQSEDDSGVVNGKSENAGTSGNSTSKVKGNAQNGKAAKKNRFNKKGEVTPLADIPGLSYKQLHRYLTSSAYANLDDIDERRRIARKVLDDRQQPMDVKGFSSRHLRRIKNKEVPYARFHSDDYFIEARSEAANAEIEFRKLLPYDEVAKVTSKAHAERLRGAVQKLVAEILEKNRAKEQPEEEPADPEAPIRVTISYEGHTYVRGAFIAKGSVKRVYECEREDEAKVKFAWCESIAAVEDDELDPVFEEWVLLSKFKHENIIKPVAFRKRNGISVMICPRARMTIGSLFASIRHRAETEGVDLLGCALATMRGVAKALLYLEGEGFEGHGDVKAANILMFADGSVKLCDFGNIVPKGEVPDGGTATAMTHQMHRGEQSINFDVFALGITFIELLTGVTPYLDITSQCVDRAAMENILAMLKSSGITPPEISIIANRYGGSVGKFFESMLQDDNSRYTIGDVVKHPLISALGESISVAKFSHSYTFFKLVVVVERFDEKLKIFMYQCPETEDELQATRIIDSLRNKNRRLNPQELSEIKEAVLQSLFIGRRNSDLSIAWQQGYAARKTTIEQISKGIPGVRQGVVKPENCYWYTTGGRLFLRKEFMDAFSKRERLMMDQGKSGVRRSVGDGVKPAADRIEYKRESDPPRKPKLSDEPGTSRDADEVKPKSIAQCGAAASSAKQGKRVKFNEVPSFCDPAKITTVASFPQTEDDSGVVNGKSEDSGTSRSSTSKAKGNAQSGAVAKKTRSNKKAIDEEMVSTESDGSAEDANGEPANDFKDLGMSTEKVGCDCKKKCLPETCFCALNGIECQIEGKIGCECTAKGCKNPGGRYEYSYHRISRANRKTLKRLEDNETEEV